MASKESFLPELLQFARSLPDELFVELIGDNLPELVKSMLAADGGAKVGRVARRPRRTRGARVNREELLLKVEKVVKASAGLSAGEVAKAAGVAQPATRRALKDLRTAKRVAMAGDRKFARYAGDAKTAAKASAAAKKGS